MVTLPTKNEIYEAILADLNAEYGITIPVFGKNFLRAMAMVQAGTHWFMYKAIGNTQKNIFIDTADPEAQGGTLERFGRIKLGRNPNPATSSVYTVQFTATTGTIPASTTFKSDDGSLNPGELYMIDQASILVAPYIYTVISTNRGLATKLEIGDTVTVTSPVPGLTPVGIVVGETIAPVDAENIEDYRRKGLDSYRLEPQGGSGSDYRIWASEVSGVLQSYPFTPAGASVEVNLFIESTKLNSIDGKGTPSPAMLAGVTVAVESATALRPGRKPLVNDVNYLPVSPLVVIITISGATGWIVPAIEANISLLIEEKVDKIRPFISSIDVLANKSDTFGINDIIAIIASNYPGQPFSNVSLNVGGLPVTSSSVFTNGDIPFFLSFNSI